MQGRKYGSARQLRGEGRRGEEKTGRVRGGNNRIGGDGEGKISQMRESKELKIRQNTTLKSNKDRGKKKSK